MSTLDDLLNTPRSGTSQRGTPGAFCAPEGDCVFFYNEDVPYRRVRVDEILTIYRAEDDNRCIGAQIKNVTYLPIHDLMQLRVREHKGVTAIELLLLSFKATELKDPMQRAERLRGYDESMRALAQHTLPADQLMACAAS